MKIAFDDEVAGIGEWMWLRVVSFSRFGSTGSRRNSQMGETLCSPNTEFFRALRADPLPDNRQTLLGSGIATIDFCVDDEGKVLAA